MTFETFLKQHRYPFSDLNTFYVYKDRWALGVEPSCTIYRDCGEIDLRMSGFDGFLLSDLMNFEVLESWQEPNDGYTVIRVAVKVPKDEDNGKSSETNSEKENIEAMGLLFEEILLKHSKEIDERLDKVEEGLKEIDERINKVEEGLKDLGNSAKQNMQAAMDMVFEHNAAVFAGEKDPYYEKMLGECEKCEENVNSDGKSSETNSENGTDDEKMVRLRKPAEFTFTIEGQENIDKLWKTANFEVKSVTPVNYISEDEEKEGDNINHPTHYASASNGIECIDAIEAATEDLNGLEAVCVANILKYVWRFKRKNGIEDLKKARWYLEKLIGNEEKGEKN